MEIRKVKAAMTRNETSKFIGDLPVGIILETRDYNKFRIIDGNRSIDRKRVERIKKSINDVGFVSGNAVLVNERFEIIDGQGRFTALKELDMPVPYVITEGSGIKECIALNNSTTAWTIVDYIEAYSESNDDYALLSSLYNKYFGQGIPQPVIWSVATGKKTEGVEQSRIKNGIFSAGTTYSEASKMLDKLLEFKEHVNALGGNKASMFIGIKFALMHDEIDNDRLIEKFAMFASRPNNPWKPTNVRSAIEIIEDCYNRGLKRNRVFLTTDYVKECINNTNAYEARWCKKND